MSFQGRQVHFAGSVGFQIHCFIVKVSVRTDEEQFICQQCIERINVAGQLCAVKSLFGLLNK